MCLIKKEKFESRQIAQLFTSQAITKVADGDLSFLIKIASDFLIPKSYPMNVAEVFELAFKDLSINYNNEYYFKNTLVERLLIEKHANKNVTILSEFRVGENKADFVIINGTSTCYEIKTKYDNLKRLPDQLLSYSKIFDKTYVVCDDVHVESVLSCIPDHIGVLQFTKRRSLREIKKAIDNKVPLDKDVLMNSLRKDEYQYIAESIVKMPMNSSNTNLYNDCLEIFRTADTEVLKSLFKKSIKKFRKLDSAFIDTLPNSLLNSAVSYKLSKSRKANLLNMLEKEIYKEETCIIHS